MDHRLSGGQLHRKVHRLERGVLSVTVAPHVHQAQHAKFRLRRGVEKVLWLELYEPASFFASSSPSSFASSPASVTDPLVAVEQPRCTHDVTPLPLLLPRPLHLPHHYRARNLVGRDQQRRLLCPVGVHRPAVPLDQPMQIGREARRRFVVGPKPAHDHDVIRQHVARPLHCPQRGAV